MKKFTLCCVCFIFCFSFAFCLSACDKNETPAESGKKVMINNVNYDSLTEAVERAKSGDTLRIYDDLNEHKNVVINKPINIEGVLGASKVRPKFYGSIYVDAGGENDSVSIENIDIIHDGTADKNLVNDLTCGVKVVDGGIKMQYCRVSVMDKEKANDAVGVMISRKKGSKNLMSIVIKGNDFDLYKNENSLGAFVIKSGGDFEKLTLDNDKLYNENVFAHSEEGVQFLAITLPSNKISYLVTSSADNLIKALSQSQNDDGSTFKLIAISDLSKTIENGVDVKEKTSLDIKGGPCSFGGQRIVNFGVINIDAELKDLKVERGSSTASIVFNKSPDESVEVK